MHRDFALFSQSYVRARAFSCRVVHRAPPAEGLRPLCARRSCAARTMMLRRHRKCVFHDVSVCLRRTRGDSAVKISLKTRELFWNPLVLRRLVSTRLQRAAMFRTARSDAIAPSSKLDDWGQQACLRRCKNASIMMLCRATNVARATGRRTFADGPLLKTMLYDLHVCSQRTAKDPSTARAPNRH